MFSRTQFSGPARQRGAIGLIGALALGTAVLCTLVVVDSGRLYLDQRELQRVADNAALEAVARGGNCQAGLSAAAFARESAARNGFAVGDDRPLTATCGSLQTGADNLRTFSPNASQASAIRVVVSERVPTSIALGVTNLFSDIPLSTDTRLSAMAVAAAPTPSVAQLSIRSTLLTVDTAESNLLNAVASGLLGGNVSLSAAGWNGLLQSNINLLKYLDQLAINLNVTAGDYNQLVATDATVTQLIQAAATVVQANGATADVLTALASLQLAATGSNPVKLGDILQLQTGTVSTGLDASVQLFQLMQAFIELASSKSAIAATLPISALGLADVTTKIKVIEPPRLSAIGDPELAKASPRGPDQIYVRAAQVRVLLSVNLPVLSSVSGLSNAVLGLVGTLTPTVNSLLSLNLVDTINSLSCLLGAGCQQLSPQLLPSPQIDIVLEAGGAESYVTDYSCPVSGSGTKSLTAHTSTSLANLKVGQIDDPASAFSSSASPSVKPLPLVDLGVWTCHKILGIGSCGPARTAYAAGGLAIMTSTSVAPSTQDLVFSSNTAPFPIPANVKLEPSFQTVQPTSNVVASLASTLAGISLITYKPLGGNPLGSVVMGVAGLISDVSTILTPLITGLLSPLLDPLLNKLLTSLGIDLMNVEVGANLTCGQTGRAYLVL
ncbi:TadG family pilus assembly protein [Pseudomonas chlororaphis subsp. aurantiaca]|uniref:TadG family pilus assembly protein n=1 Tax=Pseudomonas chlororaphis TaxID=587753 RepID=UPI000F570E02|nr:TadG family pilus assembly protein [Pseudomonas chlororaphis]AZD52573.1 putative transmembrane protein [Pseudomonas chlororaphis subsp. aurantiaca]AZD58694.1 putative transmembrane protein [Pseudomonas chlororaphis subsp. aurantiaca]